MSQKIATNIKLIQDTIAQHNPDNRDVKVVAVTKSVGEDTMRTLYKGGIRNFGENRVDQLLGKKECLTDLDNIEWHYIGRLQTRPVRRIINDIDYLHSLDRLSLADEIQKRANQTVKCFVQINVSGEKTKTGFHPSEVEEFLRAIENHDKIEVVGLMTMAPYEASKEMLADIFDTMHELQQTMAALNLKHAPCTELSMGMSNDYPEAVEHGATVVRIGTAFFK